MCGDIETFPMFDQLLQKYAMNFRSLVRKDEGNSSSICYNYHEADPCVDFQYGYPRIL
jgi:hypothetical protein